MRCLPPIPSDYDKSNSFKVYASMAVFEKKPCEPAGHSYHQYCRSASGLSETDVDSDSVEEKDGDSVVVEDDTKENAPLGNSEENLYEVLGLGHLGLDATPVQIKKAYQKVALLHHPDKKMSSGMEADEVNKRWLLVQKAWETLSNKQKRRQYDSNFDFDDWIPSGREVFETADEFFSLYRPVFKRNARFSQKKNVPDIGDDKTDIKSVHKFYTFWNRFESWREFAQADEYNEIDLKNAECREEKRWMMRRNETIRKKLKMKEYARLAELVSRAYNCDPRLVREREQTRLEKDRKVQERKLQKEKAEQEAKIAAEAEAKEEEAATVAKAAKQEQKREKQAAKKRLKKKKKQLLKLCTLALEVLEVEPNDKVAFYAAHADITEEAETEQDLDRFFSAFGEFNETNTTTNEGKEAAAAGLALFKA